MPGGRTRTLVALLASLTLFLAACGDDGGSTTAPDPDPSSEGDGSGSDDGDTGDEVADDLQDSVDEMVEDLEDQQAAQGGGSATLAVGDQEWTFAPVLCAFGEDQIGQEGAVFTLSAIQDGMQMYASIDGFGHNVSLDDITDFENPSVSLTSLFGEEFINLDGKSVNAETGFMDNTSDNFDTTPGTFTATCP